jgi:hypothetical protein
VGLSDGAQANVDDDARADAADDGDAAAASLAPRALPAISSHPGTNARAAVDLTPSTLTRRAPGARAAGLADGHLVSE